MTDDDAAIDARKFWPSLQRLLQQNPNANAVSDLLSEYRDRGLTALIDDDAAENPEHREMLENAIAISRS